MLLSSLTHKNTDMISPTARLLHRNVKSDYLRSKKTRLCLHAEYKKRKICLKNCKTPVTAMQLQKEITIWIHCLLDKVFVYHPAATHGNQALDKSSKMYFVFVLFFPDESTQRDSFYINLHKVSINGFISYFIKYFCMFPSCCLAPSITTTSTSYPEPGEEKNPTAWCCHRHVSP